ncbi:MAG: preprotein translocase subunit SecG [Pseudomonadota bacterium]|nr:preprotein translocase subunit SecG [Pseudomonadota bacterium]
MITVILTIHTLIVLALIGVVLLQRSEGGALGMGGGGGGFMTGRGAATALTRTTSVLAALFFVTSITLAIFAGGRETNDSLIEELTRPAPASPTTETGAPPATTADDLLRTLGAGASDEPAPATTEDTAAPEAEQPSTDAGDAPPAEEPQPELHN